MITNTMNKCAYLDGKVYGQDVSDNGKEAGRLDYACLSRILQGMGGCILNNNLINEHFEDWELYNGEDCDDETGEYIEFYQYYIIDDEGAAFLKDHSNETIYYNEELDINLWAVAHYGTPWAGVLTDIELIPFDEYFKIDA